MARSGDDLMRLLVRMAAAICLLALGVRIIGSAGVQETGAPAVGLFLGGVLLVVLFGAIIAWPIAQFIANPSGRLFFPTHYRKHKLPIYGIPESLRQRRDLMGAYEAFGAIADEHPQELRAYEGMIEVAARDLCRIDLAEGAYARGLSELTDSQARRDLAVMYKGLISMAEPREPTHPAKVAFTPRAARQD